MVCIRSMAKSLLPSQVLRLMKSEDQKSIRYVGYWMGELLGDLLPGIELGEHAVDSVVYFDYLATLIVDAKLADQITVGNWKLVTNKIIYSGFSQDFVVPKVEVESGISYKQVWRRLSSPSLTSTCKEILFLLIHNKLPVKERLFRIRLAVDPYCEHCFDTLGAAICDVEHFFCSCSRVAQTWGRLKDMVVNMLGFEVTDISDGKLINLCLPNNRRSNEVIWLLGTYVGEVWRSIFVKGAAGLNDAQFFGFLKFKYKTDQLGARLPLLPIPGLL